MILSAFFQETILIITPILTVLIFAVALFLIFRKEKLSYGWLESWADYYRFAYYPGGGRSILAKRLVENPNKKFFEARTVDFSAIYLPGIEGVVANRQIWVYPIIGVYPFMQVGQESRVDMSGRQSQDSRMKFYGWCLEIATKQLPIEGRVTKKVIGGDDRMHIESGEFEKKYEIDVYAGAKVYQFLDPGMISLIMESNIMAVEFSGTSIVLYYTLHKASQDILDNLLEFGEKMANQIDRNFPLNK